MSKITIHSGFGVITAEPMALTDINKSIPENTLASAASDQAHDEVPSEMDTGEQ